MKTDEMQNKLIDAMSGIVDYKISMLDLVNNKIGYVKYEPVGYQCIVQINKDEVECLLTEHLQTWIQKNDIVLVQDIYGTGDRMVVIGKTGSMMKTPSLVFYDEKIKKNIGGRDGVFQGEEHLDTAGTVIIE